MYVTLYDVIFTISQIYKTIRSSNGLSTIHAHFATNVRCDVGPSLHFSVTWTIFMNRVTMKLLGFKSDARAQSKLLN